MKADFSDFFENFFHFEIGTHKSKKVIWIGFENNSVLRAQLRAIVNVYWSKSLKKWYAFDTEENRKLFKINTVENINQNKYISPINIPALNKYVQQLKLKGYSAN